MTFQIWIFHEISGKNNKHHYIFFKNYIFIFDACQFVLNCAIVPATQNIGINHIYTPFKRDNKNIGREQKDHDASCPIANTREAGINTRQSGRKQCPSQGTTKENTNTPMLGGQAILHINREQIPYTPALMILPSWIIKYQQTNNQTPRTLQSN